MNNFETSESKIRTQCFASSDIDASRCEHHLNFGIFFDGTDNNKDYHKDLDTNTNIARLSLAYKQDRKNGYFRIYIPGVGTPLTNLERSKVTEIEKYGAEFGNGGSARINFAILEVIKTIDEFSLASGPPILSLSDMKALCSSTTLVQTYHQGENKFTRIHLNDKQQVLKKFGLSAGLDGPIGIEEKAFYENISKQMREAIKSGPRKIKVIYLDVFGFSRGAAQARSFCNSLLNSYEEKGTGLVQNKKLFGEIEIHVRMLGIFDTVASVGPTAALPFATGHSAWATPEKLRIHPDIHNCYHICALHEFRDNFPLDSITVNGELQNPQRHQEVFAPGSHSDVGGGYGAGDQGKIVGPSFEKDDRYRLSAYALNLMYEAAVKSSKWHSSPPWMKLESVDWLKNIFSFDQIDEIKQDVQNYFNPAKIKYAECASIAEAVKVHALRYFAWRHAVSLKNGFQNLQSYKNATALGHRSIKFYQRGEDIFADQIKTIRRNIKDLNKPHAERPEYTQRIGNYHNCYDKIFLELEHVPLESDLPGNSLYPFNPEDDYFFDRWVHDSYAGFIEKFQAYPRALHSLTEKQRYIRWRGLYQGTDEDVLKNDATMPTKPVAL